MLCCFFRRKSRESYTWGYYCYCAWICYCHYNWRRYQGRVQIHNGECLVRMFS